MPFRISCMHSMKSNRYELTPVTCRKLDAFDVLANYYPFCKFKVGFITPVLHLTIATKDLFAFAIVQEVIQITVLLPTLIGSQCTG